MSLSALKQHALDTIQAYSANHGERLAAALAYYATFSLAPLIVLALAVAGLLYGRRSEAAQAELMAVAGDVLGADGARMLEGVLEAATAAPGANQWATLASTLVLVVGATALFARLQDALNTIWDATPSRTGILGFLWSRGLSLLLVMGTGVVMVASLVLSSLLTGFAEWIAAPVLLGLGERLLSLALLTLLFAVLYRTLPDAPVQWADVGGGAFGAAVLVTLGTAGLGWYLGHASVTSAYGAAGALVAFLLWIYYTAQIFFLGAAWTSIRAQSSPVQTAESTAVPAPAASSTEASVASTPWRTRLGWAALGAALGWFLRR